MADEDIKPDEELDVETKEESEDTEDLGEEEDEVDELDKPITKREWQEWQEQQKKNKFFAKKRQESKRYQSDPKKSEEDNPLVSRLSAIEISNAKRDFGYQNKLSPKEVDLVWKFSNGKPTAKTLEDPFVQGGLEKLRTSENLKNNLPSGSGATSFEVSGKKWEDLTLEEKQKNFADKQKAILSNKK